MKTTRAKNSRAGRALEACGMNYADLATTLGISIGTVNNKMLGRSRFTAEQARHLQREYGAEGVALVDAVETAFRVFRQGETQAEMDERRRETIQLVLVEDRVVEPDIMLRDDGRVDYFEPDDANDTELYTIDEWKARFGEPGMASDRHGRMLGYFSTDPDYCEE